MYFITKTDRASARSTTACGYFISKSNTPSANYLLLASQNGTALHLLRPPDEFCSLDTTSTMGVLAFSIYKIG